MNKHHDGQEDEDGARRDAAWTPVHKNNIRMCVNFFTMNVCRCNLRSNKINFYENSEINKKKS